MNIVTTVPLIDWGNFNIFTALFGTLTPTEAYLLMGIFGVIGVIVLKWFIGRVRGRQRDPNEPLSTLDEFEKPGTVKIYEIDRELEGSAFLSFERANGDIDTKGITQPFTFVMESGAIERHHLNARGAFRCLDPAKIFKNYVPNIHALNNIAAFTEQLIRALRVGSLIESKASSHLRTFVLIFLLSGAIGIAIAAATIRHAP